MSLQVWLPLNGNLNNQGLSGMTFSYINITGALGVNSSGKIGYCYERTVLNASDLIRSNQTINLNGDLSMACWAYVSETVGDTANGLITNHSHEDNTGVGITVKQISTSDYRICCNTGTGSDRTFYTYYGTTNIKNTWHHLALTYNKTAKQLQLWVDGKVEYILNNYTNASKEDYIDIFNWSTTYHTGANYRPKCKLNDVRVYDHCLSAKEVKEIANGLVCHYKLAGIGGENLISSMSAGSRTTVIDNYGISADFSQNLDTYAFLNVSPSLELNKTYTLSFDVSNFPDNGTWNWKLWNTDNYLFTVNKNGHYSYTFTPTASLLPSDYSLTQFLFDDGARINPANVVKFTNFKIEEGTVATSWSPHKSDTLYTTLGLSDGIEYDCSGYGYNGSKYGDIAWSNNSARYSGSYKFNGSDNSIQIGNLANIVPEGIFTMNCWIYKDSFGSKTWETIFGGPSGFELQSKNGSSAAPVLFAYSWGQNYCSYELNKWNMITMVRTLSDTKFYVNGELKFTGTAGTIPSGNYFVGTWRDANSQNYKGNISDFRIYATALSAEDIRELYQSSMSIDKNRAIYAYSLEEV